MFWLFEMIEGGEDPKFIARAWSSWLRGHRFGRSQRLSVAVAAAQANDMRLPESAFALASGHLLVARAPKSNAVSAAMVAAKKDIANDHMMCRLTW